MGPAEAAVIDGAKPGASMLSRLVERLLLFWGFGVVFSVIPFAWIWVDRSWAGRSVSVRAILGQGELFPVIVALAAPVLGAMIVFGIRRSWWRTPLAVVGVVTAFVGVTSAGFFYKSASTVPGGAANAGAARETRIAHTSIWLFFVTMAAVSLCMLVTEE